MRSSGTRFTLSCNIDRFGNKGRKHASAPLTLIFFLVSRSTNVCKRIDSGRARWVCSPVSTRKCRTSDVIELDSTFERRIGRCPESSYSRAIALFVSIRKFV